MHLANGHNVVALRFAGHRTIRNVDTKSLTGFKLYATSANKCQHCCGSTQNGRNMLDPTMLRVVGCMLLANNVASVCMGL